MSEKRKALLDYLNECNREVERVIEARRFAAIALLKCMSEEDAERGLIGRKEGGAM